MKRAIRTADDIPANLSQTESNILLQDLFDLGSGKLSPMPAKRDRAGIEKISGQLALIREKKKEKETLEQKRAALRERMRPIIESPTLYQTLHLLEVTCRNCAAVHVIPRGLLNTHEQRRGRKSPVLYSTKTQHREKDLELRTHTDHGETSFCQNCAY